MDHVRAFIAIPLPDAVKIELVRVAREMASATGARAVRWVKSERMHLTMRFLADTPVSELPAIGRELDQLAARSMPFVIQLDNVGCFPNRRRARVIWVGLKGNRSALEALRSGMDEHLAELGWKREGRPFRAHLTVGRVKDSRKLDRINWGVKVNGLAIPVSTIQLIKSELQPGGPRYTVLHTAHLRGD